MIVIGSVCCHLALHFPFTHYIVLYCLTCNHFYNEVRREVGLEVVLSVKGTGEMKSEVIDLNYCFIYCLTLGKHPGLNLLICKMR